MKKILFALLAAFLVQPAEAQTTDSLWVKVLNNKWDIVHRMKSGETVFGLAKVYQAPPAEIARENGISYRTQLDPGLELYIPLGIYNRISQAGVAGTRPLYYKTSANDDWARVAYLAGTSARQIRDWNNLPMAALKAGQTLLVGWVKYSAADEAPVPVTTQPSLPDSSANAAASAPVPEVQPVSPEEEQFNLMTNGGQHVQTEKGAAIYFDSKTSGHVYYAFFNLAPRGAVIKVVNPGNGKYVFAKVIGTIPEQDRYRNALIGLSISAQKILGGKGSRTWCEVQY